MASTVRFATEEDGERIRAIYGPYVRDSVISFEETPPSIAETKRRIAATIEQYPWLVCEHSGMVIGYAYAGPHRSREAYRWSIDCSAYVDQEYHRNGVARGLYESLFALCSIQGFRNAYAGITLPNEASVSFHEDRGFEPVGVYERVGYKHGDWHDVGWWAKSLAEYPPDPDPPLSIEQARLREGWNDALTAGRSVVRL